MDLRAPDGPVTATANPSWWSSTDPPGARPGSYLKRNQPEGQWCSPRLEMHRSTNSPAGWLTCSPGTDWRRRRVLRSQRRAGSGEFESRARTRRALASPCVNFACLPDRARCAARLARRTPSCPVVLGVIAYRRRSVGGVGTAWSGTAERLSLGGVTLGPVSWNLRPSRLLTGQLAADIEATLPDGFANGSIAAGVGGKIAISDLEAAAPLAWIAPAAGAAGGQVAARFEKLAVNGGRVETAKGTLKVAGVVLPTDRRAPLGAGTYAVAFDAEARNPGNPLPAC